MLEARKALEDLKHEIKMPPEYVDDGKGGEIFVKDRYREYKEIVDDESVIWKTREEAMRNHNEKIVWSDAILVLNLDKNDIAGYIGANTLMEMGLAFHLKKPIYLLNQIPDISYREEILGMHPIVINGDFSKMQNN